MINYPKIIFRYSKIYDEYIGKEKPSETAVVKTVNYIKKLRNAWGKKEEKILKEISQITGLKWRENYIHCYIVRRGGGSISDPLTLVMYNKKGALGKLDLLIDLLVHELIHRIFTSKENFQKSKKAWDYIYKKYKNEIEKTKIHIVIHAIYKDIYLKFYNKKRLERHIQWASEKKDYQRAWQIVEKEGYQNIINQFIKRIK